MDRCGEYRLIWRIEVWEKKLEQRLAPWEDAVKKMGVVEKKWG
jgi:hypothetical protein